MLSLFLLNTEIDWKLCIISQKDSAEVLHCPIHHLSAAYTFLDTEKLPKFSRVQGFYLLHIKMEPEKMG